MSSSALAALLTGAIGIGSVSSPQETPQAITVRPCEEQCGLFPVVLGEFGESDGPGMIERDGIIGYPDASGRMYVVGAADHVLVFGADGSFLTRVGRRGEGPGELLDIASLSVLEDGVFLVLDRDRSVAMKFDWTGSLLHEVRTRGWTPWSTGTVVLDGNIAVHARHIRTPERVGYPLHSINLGSGEIVASFGSQTGRYDPRQDRLLDVIVARGPGGIHMDGS